jgi:aminopeptidase N
MDPSNNLTREEAAERAGLVSDVSYDVHLDLTTGDDTFICDTTVRFASSGASTFLDLVAPSVESIEVNGVGADPASFDGARIHLTGLAGRNEVRVRATCAYMNTGSGLHHFRDPVDGKVYLHTQFETFDAHRVYPCFDQPDVKATFALTVSTPPDWVAVSNEKGEKNGDGVWTFPATKRMSTYITALVAGPYHSVSDRHGGIDLGLYCRQSLAEYLDADEILEITKQGFDFYERVFDYPYAFGKYDQLFVPEFSAGAMENAGCVTFHEGFIFRSKVTEAARERRAEVILHEMAHMWFGDLVTMKWWDDLWLNESFATYMSILSQVGATRFTNGWTTFANDVKSSARRQDQLPSTHPIAADVPDVDSVRLNFDAITYEKGASVLRQLGAWVGEQRFLESLQGYFRRHEYANATLADFLTALEEGSGRDLASWSSEWLETAGLNTFRPAISDDAGRYSSVAILQEAEPRWPTLRSHRAAVGLYDRHGSELQRRRLVELDVVGAQTDVKELTGEPVADLLLINDGDLAYAKIRLDDRSLDTVANGLSSLSDPLARALCWAAVWDMVRDGEMPASRHLRMICDQIDGETDIGVVQGLLGQAASDVWMYGDPRRAADSLAILAARARRGLVAAAPGSDGQLVWARTFISTARSDGDVAFVKGLLDGSDVVDGLAVDTDLRWAIVNSLAATGAAGDDLIDAELAIDPTDLGNRQAAAARAARPSAEAKEKAWKGLLEDESLPLATIRSTIVGFQRDDQADLLEPYATQYFRAIDSIWSGRDIDTALQMLRGLYPRVAISQQVVDATTTALDGDLPGPVHRILLEGRDQMERALRARSVDAGA